MCPCRGRSPISTASAPHVRGGVSWCSSPGSWARVRSPRTCGGVSQVWDGDHVQAPHSRHASGQSIKVSLMGSNVVVLPTCGGFSRAWTSIMMPVVRSPRTWGSVASPDQADWDRVTASSPPPWGSVNLAPVDNDRLGILPTHVGVVCGQRAGSRQTAGVPHICGGSFVPRVGPPDRPSQAESAR